MASNERLVWPDVTRASCITLVVVYHVVSKSLEELSWAPGSVRDVWFAVDQVLLPARIPLFFAVSGFLSAGALAARPIGILWKRILGPYALYLVWLAIHFVFFLFPWPIQTTRLNSPVGVVAVVVGFTTVWYLYALPAYFVYTYVTRRMPLAVAVAPPVVLSVLGYAEVLPSGGTSDTLIASLLYFVLGARCSGTVRALSRWSTPGRGAAAAAAFLAVSAASFFTAFRSAPGMLTVLGLLGCFAGVLAFCSITTDRPPVLRTITWIGARTLPIYVLHIPVLAVLQALALRLAPPEPVSLGLAVLWPILLTAIIIGCCLGMHALLLRTPARAIFQPLPTPRIMASGAVVNASPPHRPRSGRSSVSGRDA